MKDFHLFQGTFAFVALCFIMNLVLGRFNPGATPVAHTAHLANFLGMALTGLCAVLLGGCPFRQTIMAGYGNTDSGMAVLGMLVGAGFAHNFMLAAGPDKVTDGVRTVGGPVFYGWVAVVVGIAFCLIIGFSCRSEQ